MSKDSLAMLPFFPRDFIAATRTMSLAERGAYCDLLFFQWEIGKIPADFSQISRLLGCRERELKKLWKVIGPKFVERDGCLVNVRLEEHRTKALEAREKKVDGANRTNAKRYGERSLSGSLSDPLSEPLSGSPPSPSPSPSPSSVRFTHMDAREAPSSGEAAANGAADPLDASATPSEQDIHARVAEIKANYPDGGRANWIVAEHHIRREVAKGEPWSSFLLGTIRYREHCKATGRLVMNPEKFYGDVDRPWTQAWKVPDKPEHKGKFERSMERLRNA